MLSDFHLHSCFSPDTDIDDMELIIQKAIQLGMRHICITDHQDYDFPAQPHLDFNLDTVGYYERFCELKEKYNDQIDLYLGAETGLEPYLSDRLSAFAKSLPFDFIIGSTHVIDRQNPYNNPYFFERRGEQKTYERYYMSIIEVLDKCSDFDVYGHLDYITRYAPNPKIYYDYENYADLIDIILSTLIHSGKGIEINTGGYRCNLNTPNPCPRILKRYKELGGEIITVGSDAHILEQIGDQFDNVKTLLLTLGYRYYTIFKERKPIFIPLL